MQGRGKEKDQEERKIGIVKEEKILLLPLSPSTILGTGLKQGCPSEPQRARDSPRNAHAH